MKLYVWEDFNSDYTPGLAFALAETKEEAIELLGLYNDPEDPNYFKGELNASEPQIFEITEKVAFLVTGGG